MTSSNAGSSARLLLAALALAAPGSAVRAEAEAAPPPLAACLAFADAVSVAARQDPRVGRADATAERSEAQVKVARGAALPQVSAFNRVGAGDGAAADNQVDNRVGVRLSQQLFDFGQTTLERRVAEARAASAGYAADDTRLSVAEEAGRRHLGVARALARADAAAVLARYYARDADQADRRLQEGLLKLSEAASIKAEYARAAADEAEERLRVEQERTALSTLIGGPVPCIDEGSSEGFLVAGQPAGLDLALDESLTDAPSLKSSQAAADAAALDRRRQQREGLPQVSVSVTSAYDFGLNGARQGQVNRLGLDVTAPIFQGGQNRGRVDALAAEARAAGYALATERRELIQGVTISWTRAERLVGIVRLQHDSALAAAAQAEALEREYEAQLVTLTELIDARRAEHQSRLAEIEARYELAVERLTLMRLTGRLTGEDGR